MWFLFRPSNSHFSVSWNQTNVTRVFFLTALGSNSLARKKMFHMFIHLEKLSLPYPFSLCTLSTLMWLSMYKYHSLSFQVSLGFNYGLWEMSWMLSTLEPGENDLFRMGKGILFLWKRKKRSLVQLTCDTWKMKCGWSQMMGARPRSLKLIH